MEQTANDSSGARPGRRFRWPHALALAAGLAIFLAGTGYDYREFEPPPADETASGGGLEERERENRRLLAELSRRAPRRNYIVIDRANNRLYLRRGEKTLLEAVCSTGSGAMLQDSKGERQWVFDTPGGMFRVLQKKEDPVWRKPDWAFVEEGLPLPSDPGERIDYDAMGEYALAFGDGYFIHGTLYERLLGRSVTHGCIRLGSEDLRKVYRQSEVGTPIYIF